VERILTSNFTILNPLTNRSESYREFCFSFCQINEPFIQFVNGYLLQKSLSEGGVATNERIELAYPISTFYNRRMNIQPHFFGLKFNETITDEETPDNSTAVTVVKRNPKLISAKMLALQLRAERKEGWTEQMVKAYEMSITLYFEKFVPF
ncbi:hypothetical protein GCK32_018189, partial [Trichostrongylus colubriformis]